MENTCAMDLLSAELEKGFHYKPTALLHIQVSEMQGNLAEPNWLVKHFRRHLRTGPRQGCMQLLMTGHTRQWKSATS
jgi:hypothetical protein